jgi:hypothetical protein
MRPLGLPRRVPALIRPLPLPVAVGAAAFVSLLLRPGLLGGAGALFFLLLLLAPERLGLEFVPVTADVFEPRVKGVSIK